MLRIGLSAERTSDVSTALPGKIEVGPLLDDLHIAGQGSLELPGIVQSDGGQKRRFAVIGHDDQTGARRASGVGADAGAMRRAAAGAPLKQREVVPKAFERGALMGAFGSDIGMSCRSDLLDQYRAVEERIERCHKAGLVFEYQAGLAVAKADRVFAGIAGHTDHASRGELNKLAVGSAGIEIGVADDREADINLIKKGEIVLELTTGAVVDQAAGRLEDAANQR